MISEEIIRKISEKEQTSELNIRREYFQHLFLSRFYTQKGTDKVFFKGGTALRMLYRSPRFSEDLDFTGTAGSISTIEQAIINTLAEIEREGVITDLKEAKTTSGGYLAQTVFSAFNRTIEINTEVSFRPGKKEGHLMTLVNNFVPTYTITVLSQNQLIREKFNALLDRKKPRDFYDLYFILRANLLPPQEKGRLKLALEALHSSDIKFGVELKEFLPKGHWPMIRNFPKALEREIKRFV